MDNRRPFRKLLCGQLLGGGGMTHIPAKECWLDDAVLVEAAGQAGPHVGGLGKYGLGFRGLGV